MHHDISLGLFPGALEAHHELNIAYMDCLQVTSKQTVARTNVEKGTTTVEGHTYDMETYVAATATKCILTLRGYCFLLLNQ